MTEENRQSRDALIRELMRFHTSMQEALAPGVKPNDGFMRAIAALAGDFGHDPVAQLAMADALDGVEYYGGAEAVQPVYLTVASRAARTGEISGADQDRFNGYRILEGYCRARWALAAMNNTQAQEGVKASAMMAMADAVDGMPTHPRNQLAERLMAHEGVRLPVCGW